jgi:hypothetical protein
MNHYQPLSSRTENFTFTRLALAFALVTLLLAANLSGVGVTYDTTEYFAGAKSIAETGTFSSVDGRPQATWPPGYSFLLSIPIRTGLSLNASSLLVAALSLVAIVWSAIRILSQSSMSPRSINATLAWMLLSPGLVTASSLALSELPFIALLLGSWALLTQKDSTLAVLSSAVILGSATMVRYVGIFLIPLYLLLAITYNFSRHARKKCVLRGIIFLFVASSMPYLWRLRNIRETGTASGNREPGGGSFSNAARESVRAFGESLVNTIDIVPDNLLLVLGSLVIFALINALIFNLFHRRFDLAVVAAIPLAYLAFTAFRFVKFEYAPIDSRAVTPMIPFAVLPLVATHWPLKFTNCARRAAPFVMLPLLFGSLLEIRTKALEPQAWGSSQFQESPLAKTVKQLSDGSVIISNFPQRAFSITEISPIRNQYQFDLPAVVQCRKRYGLWFAEAPFQGNEPKLAAILYEDAEGRIYDLGDCSTPAKSFWE